MTYSVYSRKLSYPITTLLNVDERVLCTFLAYRREKNPGKFYDLFFTYFKLNWSKVNKRTECNAYPESIRCFQRFTENTDPNGMKCDKIYWRPTLR